MTTVQNTIIQQVESAGELGKWVRKVSLNASGVRFGATSGKFETQRVQVIDVEYDSGSDLYNVSVYNDMLAKQTPDSVDKGVDVEMMVEMVHALMM